MIFLKDEINLPLAIQDYLPVALFALGLFFVAKMIGAKNDSAGKLAFVGGILITLGGAFKATWKLMQAIGGADISFFNNSLFVLLSSGFIGLAWALWKSRTSENSFAKIWLIPIILTAIVWTSAAYFAFFTESRTWFFLLLGTTTLANLALLLQLIFRSFQNKLWLAVVLFLINLLVIFALARSADQTVTMQWIKQFSTTLAQSAFAFAAFFLLKAERRKI